MNIFTFFPYQLPYTAKTPLYIVLQYQQGLCIELNYLCVRLTVFAIERSFLFLLVS